ncbi:hypothetical protein D3C86_1284930 [compost metagenome]
MVRVKRFPRPKWNRKAHTLASPAMKPIWPKAWLPHWRARQALTNRPLESSMPRVSTWRAVLREMRFTRATSGTDSE